MSKLSNEKCFFGLIYERIIAANSLTQLKRLASRIANCYFCSIDEMRVTVCERGTNTLIFNLYRYNKKAPNNTIIYSPWK